MFQQYLDSTRLPLTSLAFLIPLLVVYETGAIFLQPDFSASRHLVAASAVESFLAWFGPAGSWVPGVVLVLSLIAWHILRKDPTTVRAWVPPLMAIESLVLTLPLFVISGLARGAALPTLASVSTTKIELLLVMGAGIYEELVFRLLLITMLLVVLVDVFRVPQLYATIAAGVLASLIFATCHYAPISVEPFNATTFALRAAAGGYLTMVFLSRGIGVSAGCHVAYNVITLLMSR